MAVITTTQDGVLTGVGLTDTVIVNHNAVIVADTTFGTSPSDQTTLALTINTGGKVTINPNVTVVVRGNLTASGGSAVAIADVFDLKEGAKLLLDSSLAATPATMYKFKLSPYAKVKSTGVSTNKVVIGGSISGGGVVSDFTSYETGGLWDCVHTVFQKWGSSAVQGWKTFPKADGVVGTSVTDCEFDGCGAVRCGPYNIGGKCTFLRTKWSNTLGASSHRFDGKVGDSSQIMKDCVFDQSSGALFYPASGWDVTGTYFGKTVSSKASIVDGVDQRFLNFAGNFINNMTSNYVFEGDIKDSVILLDGGNNINMYHHYATIADAVMEGVIFDPVSVSVTSDIIFPHSRAIDYKCIYKKNIFRPLPDGTAPGKFVSIMPNSDEVGKQNVFVENNTIATHKNVIEVETGIGIGEVLSIDYTSSGDLKSYRNNIGWTALGGTPGYHITHQDSSNQNIVDPANVDYNCGFNLNTDAIYGKGFTKWPTNPTDVWPSGGLGVHDISIDPKFVDSSRCVALYDTVKLGNSVATAWASGVSYSIGDVISSTTVGLFNGLAVNFRCIKDHTSLSGNSINGVPVVAASWRTNWELMGVYRIRENVSRISDCREWIKAGFAPTEQALKGAGYLGADIGAVPVGPVAPSGGGSSNNAASSDGFLLGIRAALLEVIVSSFISPLQTALGVGADTGIVIPPHLVSAWNFLGALDPIVGPDATFSIPSPNYDEAGNAIGLNPRIDAGKGLWGGPSYTQYTQNSKFEGAGIGVYPAGWNAATTTTNGITRSIVGFGPGYIDVRFSGTCVGSIVYPVVEPSSYALPIAVLSDVWTGFAKITLLAGDWSAVSPRLAVQESTSTGAYLATSDISLVGKSGQIVSNTRTFTNASVEKCALIPFISTITVGTSVDFTVRIEQPQLTKTSSPMPYIATGIGETKTQPSNAATTGNNGLNIPMDAGMLNCLGASGASAMTLMHEAYMGVGGADLGEGVIGNFLCCTDSNAALASANKYLGTSRITRTSDGTNTLVIPQDWSPNEIHRRYCQTSSDGTRFRVGYQRFNPDMMEITAGIQWSHPGAESTWAAFDGSFNPLTYLRFGLNLFVPVWHRRFWLSNKTLTSAEINEANQVVEA